MTDSTDPSPSPSPADDEQRPGAESSGGHPDKYDDPRARVTPRGIWIGVAVAVGAVVMAGLSIYLRRTRLEKTTEFWGETTIRALQLADQVHLLPAGDRQFEPVELTALPGLGHLRRALLDQRHYRWETATDQPIADKCAAEGARCVRLRLADPSGRRVPPTEIVLELNSGWVGPADGSRRVRVNERVQPALRHQLTTWMDLPSRSPDAD